MKSKLPSDYETEKQKNEKRRVARYFEDMNNEFARRMYYCSILTLDDCGFLYEGRTDEEVKQAYKRYVTCLEENFHGYARDYKAGDLDDFKSISNAMEAELRERGFEINFE